MSDDEPRDVQDDRFLTEASVTCSSTSDGGKTQHAVDSGRNGTSPQADAGPVSRGTETDDGQHSGDRDESADLARNALAEARRIARGRPVRGPGGPARRKARREDPAARGGFSGPGPDDTDPQLVGGLLNDYVSERGWERPMSEARVFADWAALVGAEVAAHSSPTALANGELKVAAESTAWATQLRLLTSSLLARLAAELGPDVVTSIRISGPSGPSWKHGGFSVRGARGPRDTYG